MTMTPETPTEVGYYLWKNKRMSKPAAAEIFKFEGLSTLYIDTDSEREELGEFVRSQKDENLEWCRLVPAITKLGN